MLDIVERYKQIDRLKRKLPEFEEKKLIHYVETHPFQFRKYYSIGDLLNGKPLGNHTTTHLYTKLKVCNNCKQIYEKIDGYRTRFLLKPDKFNVDHVRAVLTKYFEDNPGANMSIINVFCLIRLDQRDLKQVFSPAFYEKLKYFDTDFLERMGLTKEVKIVKGYFDRPVIRESPARSPKSRHGGAFFDTSRSNISSVSILPKVHKETYKDRTNIFRLHKFKAVDKKEKHEIIGYKHLLGHIDYLPNSGAGYALSKSSYQLNKLQDRMSFLNSLTERFLEGDREEEKMLDLIFCTYYGNGVKDTSRLKKFKEEQMRKTYGMSTDRFREDSGRKSFINIIGDKFDYIPENQRTEILEKERKEKEKEQHKQVFVDNHNLLSQSIISKNTSRKVSMSSDEGHSKNTDNNSENDGKFVNEFLTPKNDKKSKFAQL